MSSSNGKAVNSQSDMGLYPRLNELFKLKKYDDDDWAMVQASESRVQEFVEAFKAAELSKEEKFEAMGLILASYDLYLSEDEDNDDEVWDPIEALLKEGGMLYDPLTKYWADLRGEGWDITPRIRDFRKAQQGIR